MNSINLSPDQIAYVRPLPGRVLLRIEENPDHIGSIIVPEIARDKQLGDVTQIAEVLAVGYDGFWYREAESKLKRYGGLTEDDVKAGDRVLFRPLASELNQRFVLTDARRVDAVIDTQART